jgi:hypothetical protein
MPEEKQYFCECPDSEMCGCGDPPEHCRYCLKDLTDEQVRAEKKRFEAYKAQTEKASESE